ncbi:type II toxin-antitoxin system VapC family toxin [Georgenia sp. TF02-10]|uniref:type II toxin-antitoxin system VapC family toxin n=1 Tax=Georgenia sp. TF02-10 TaxID=2917725 RepID=UPI001FA6CB34|nr:type II toxin-antitoxin system VapC family toxin [Georgenia sp. TF02-10]UNX55316.1 type II toxin-antitoxin system VapC family toxin [Georgenia sp. TF02-10]
MTVVLDASALLTLIFNEPGAAQVADAVASGAAVGTVNLAEAGTVLVRNGLDPRILDAVQNKVDVEPLTAEDALVVAALYPLAQPHGLSLGDRACLALARRLEAPTLTADRAWADRDLDLEIRLLRP